MFEQLKECLEKFLNSENNVGHYERNYDLTVSLKDIFENQDWVKEEIKNYINFYFPEYIKHFQNFYVLDIGCSLGNLSFAFSKEVKEVVGIDIEKEAIECAKLYAQYSNRKNVRFFVDDATSLKKVQSLNLKFDLVILKDVLEHLGDSEAVRKTFKSLKQILKKGGLVYIETPNYGFPLEHHLGIPIIPYSNKTLLKWQARLFGKIKTEKDKTFVDYLNPIVPRKLEKLLKQERFEIFNPYEDIKLKQIFFENRKLASRYRWAEKILKISRKVGFNKILYYLIRKFKLYPTLQYLAYYKGD